VLSNSALDAFDLPCIALALHEVPQGRPVLETANWGPLQAQDGIAEHLGSANGVTLAITVRDEVSDRLGVRRKSRWL
jgi:hypothetical protein